MYLRPIRSFAGVSSPLADAENRPIDLVTNNECESSTSARADRGCIDALAAKLVLRRESLDVIVASNLFGHMLSGHGPP